MADNTRAACPVEGCPCHRSPAQFVCRSHWYALPRALRSEVNDAWRSYQRKRASNPRAALGELTRYRLARGQALNLLTGKTEEPSHD